MGMCDTCKYLERSYPCSVCDGYSKYESYVEPTELKPCPFCGGEAVLCKDRSWSMEHSCEYVYVRCKECGVHTRSFITESSLGIIELHTPQDAIDAWNRRV